MGGSNATATVGVYGTQGTPSTGNVPGARGSSVGWTDSSGNVWLFGGAGLDSTGGSNGGLLNDLWKFSPTSKEWTWIGGSSIANDLGSYGTQGVFASTNLPDARENAVSWTDKSGNFWLFGGSGNGPTVPGSNAVGIGALNDLWEFNPTTSQWALVSGSNIINMPGVYGTQGVAAPGNTPSARSGAYGWTDSSGNLWLFGGGGLDEIWEFNISVKEWAWIAGSQSDYVAPVYGTQGVASATSTPGTRPEAVGVGDKNGNFWLYGGTASYGTCNDDFSDLWEFNTSTKEWTWVNGSNCGQVGPVYGTQGIASASNTPGGRENAVGWIDASGNFWLFSGFDNFDQAPATSGVSFEQGYFSDLWEFDMSSKQWNWMGGSDLFNQNGVYGTLGTPSVGNVPGARGSSGLPLALTDSNGDLWLFGGYGLGASGRSNGLLNDLWRYQL
jgi:hypothetical protein